MQLFQATKQSIFRQLSCNWIHFQATFTQLNAGLNTKLLKRCTHFTITILLQAGLSPFCCMQDYSYVQNSGCGWVGEFKQLSRCTTVKCWYTPSRREHITSRQMALCKVWLFPQILTYTDSPHLAEVPKVPGTPKVRLILTLAIWPISQSPLRD